MNNDGTTNDMIYIPAKQSDINLITITAAVLILQLQLMNSGLLLMHLFQMTNT